MKSARQSAFEALYKICYKGAYSNLEAKSAVDSLGSERAFASRLIYGVLDRMLTLDYILSKACKPPKPKLLVILRMGAYQLYFMDKVTSAAAVDESVKLAKNNGLGYYASFVNAVMHKIDKNRLDLSEIKDKSIRFSVPQPLINMWEKQYGAEATAAFLPRFNDEPSVFAVPNSFKTDAEALAESLKNSGYECEAAGGIIKLASADGIFSSRQFKEGMFFVQDINCNKAVKALGVSRGDTVLDLCASPGGKSFCAAMACGREGRVLSFDIYPERVGLIESGAKRLGIENITASAGDAAVYNAGIPKADKIICDVPCSGFGIAARKPEIRYKDLDSIKELCSLQQRILANAAGYLECGGRLMYSTCTLNKKENEKITAAFLESNDAFKAVEQKTFFPGENGGDGFYYCIIERL